MESADGARVAIPSPNFSATPLDSGVLKKANPWIDMLKDRAAPFAGRKHKKDFDSQQESYGTWGNNPSPPKNKQPKFDKYSDGKFFCETCDRGFPTDSKYKEHTMQHETCRQHKTGLFNKIKESAADIEKWISERRKNFPTKENIERKKQLEQERIERGEVLETREYGKVRGRGRGRGFIRGQCRGRGRGNYQHSQQQISQRKDEGDPLAKLADTDFDSRPVKSHIHHDTSPSSTGLTPRATLATQGPTMSSTQEVAPCAGTSGTHTALGSLMSSYADMSSEEEGEVRDDVDQPTGGSKQPESRLSKSSLAECEKQIPAASQQKTPEMQIPVSKQSTVAVAKTNQEPSSSSQRSGGNSRRKNGQRSQRARRHPPTLLEKLLANEIRHERNVLLQCVRHVVNNNFFGVGEKKERQSRQQMALNNTYEDDVW